MGYNTDFDGHFGINKPVDDETYEQWKQIYDTWIPNPPPHLSRNCGWIITENRTRIEWDGIEKFYCYIEWMRLLLDDIFIPNGYILNGQVDWIGENDDDVGTIVIRDNVLTVHTGN